MAESEIQLTAMDEANRDALAELRLGDGQAQYLGTRDLAEFVRNASLYPEFTVYAINERGSTVGLVSFGHEAEAEDAWWIPLLVVDADSQGQGIGRRALEAVVEMIRARDPGAQRVGLSYKVGNERAARLYARMGFVAAEPVDGEVVSWLPL